MSNLIYSNILDAAEDIGCIKKKGNNDRQNYKYRTAEDVINAASSAMKNNSIICIPEVLELVREVHGPKEMIHTTVRVKYTFYAEDGSSISATAVGEGSDLGDKSASKAMTNAYKQCLCQTFSIPTEEASYERRIARDDFAEDPEEKVVQFDSRREAKINAIDSFCKNHKISKEKLYLGIGKEERDLTEEDATWLLMGLNQKYGS